MGGSFVVHGVLLHPDYVKLPTCFARRRRPQYFPFMILAHVLMSRRVRMDLFRGVEAKPWLRSGIRYGCVIALLRWCR